MASRFATLIEKEILPANNEAAVPTYTKKLQNSASGIIYKYGFIIFSREVIGDRNELT